LDSSSIRLPGTEIAGATFDHGVLQVVFACAYILKTMTGSDERTLWWQRGRLVLADAELSAPLPETAADRPWICDGGDIDENVYTYRDMIPIPLDSRGLCRCDLRLRGTDARIAAQGAEIRLEMDETPKYIEHIRPRPA
jgi:hypothetical protein